LLFTFFAVIFEEAKGVAQTYTWIFKYPRVLESEVEPWHRFAVLAVNVVRTVLCIVLVYSGTIFLTEDTDYLNLIFDALSLVFIIQIDELLYTTLLRRQMKEEHHSVISGAFEVDRDSHEYTSAVLAEYSRIIFLVVLTIFLCYRHSVDTVGPLHEALQCLCTVEGPGCREANTYQAAWWDQYWTEILPTASAEIDVLLSQVEGAKSELPETSLLAVSSGVTNSSFVVPALNMSRIRSVGQASKLLKVSKLLAKPIFRHATGMSM